LTHLVGVGS